MLNESRNHRGEVPRDEYARGSFTFRRMTQGQIIGLIIALLVLIAVFFWL